jgi:hypothetical protein
MTPWIVIPVYNERETVAAVAAAAHRSAPVLVVDDGSVDDSATVAGAAGAEVIRHPRRLGKGQALRTGLAAARLRGASHVVTMDGDGQHAPEDLPVLLAAAAEDPEAIIIGGRLGSRDARAVLTTGRLNAIEVAGFFVNWVADLRIRDTQSGYRVYPLPAMDRLAARRGGFVFETEVLVRAGLHCLAVHEVPVRALPRRTRRSRFRPVGDGVAIGAYLAARCVGRWRREAVDAGAEVLALCRTERRRARHQAMLTAAAAYADVLPAWGAAVSMVALRRASSRLAVWWRHPRRCRAGVAARATLATPALLLGALLTGVAGRWVGDLVTPMVRALYRQERLGPEVTSRPTRGQRSSQAGAEAATPELG